MTSPILGNTTTTGENPAATLTGAELLRGVQSGLNVKMTAAAIAALYSPTENLGDIIVRGPSGDVRLAVGADGSPLLADSTQATGLRYGGPVPTIAQLAATGGAATIGTSTGETVEAEFARLARTAVDPTDVRYAGGAKFDGATDDTAALMAAAATGRPVHCPAGTAMVTQMLFTADACFIADSPFVTSIKLKANQNTHTVYTQGDHKLTLRFIGVDGNAANNPLLSPIYPCAVLVPVGQLDMFGCIVKDARNHCIHTGNTDYDYSSAAFAHDVRIENCLVTQSRGSSDGRGDCIRVHRTNRAKVLNNFTDGGLSSIRSNYYCTFLDIIGNTCQYNYGDVGVTLALSTHVKALNNTCTNNGQHGIECDGCFFAEVANNICTDNVAQGIMVTEYGPPSGTSYSGTVNGVALAYPTVISNYDLRVHDNVLARNGQYGIRCIGQANVTVSNNTIEGNNTATGNPYGMYIDGGSLNQDDVLVFNNDFRNTANQTCSVGQANVQGQTRTGGNFHTPGTQQWQFAVRGCKSVNSLFSDPGLLNPSNVSVTAGVLVEDTLSAKRVARQILDSNTGGNVTMQVNVANVPAPGDKFMVIRMRTPDTMTTCSINVNLYTASTFKNTVATINVTGLGSAWREFKIRIPDSAKSYAYDNVQIPIATDVTLTGSINVDEVSLFGVFEQ